MKRTNIRQYGNTDNKRIKVEVLDHDSTYEVEYLDDEASQNTENEDVFSDLESTMMHINEKLSGFEMIIENITEKFKSRLAAIRNQHETYVEPKTEEVEQEQVPDDANAITISFPLCTIEEVERFDLENLDAVVFSYIRGLFDENNGNVSILFKLIFSDDLIANMSLDTISKFKLFSNILYGKY